MGFRLSSFLGGVASGLSEKIKEDEQMTQLAMAGRIKEASQLVKARKKEIESLSEQLNGQLRDMESYGIKDADAQKAFLSSPTSWETFKKEVDSGNLPADAWAEHFIINKDKLGQSATAKEYINNIISKRSIVPTTGEEPVFEDSKGFLGMSKGRKSSMFAALAGAEGMTPEMVAAAEKSTGTYQPEVAIEMKPNALLSKEKIPTLEKASNDIRYKLATGAYTGSEKVAAENQLKTLETHIQAQKVATAKPEDAAKEKQLTYERIRTRVNDYVAERMRQNVGADWNKYIDYRQIKIGDSVYTDYSKKENMPVEAQRAMFAEEQRLKREAISALGLVDQNGQPVYAEVGNYMKMNLTPASKPAQQPTGSGNAGAPTQPAGKTVTKAQVEAVAKSQNITYDEARKAAVAEGYTIIGE